MRNVSLLALVALLVGCGGSSSGDNSFIEGSAGAVNLAFTGGTSYNGSAAALSSATSIDGSAAKSVITITATNNNRGVEVTLVANTLVTGTAVDLSNLSNTTTVVYSDATTGSTDRWGATSGTITVTSRTATSVQITLTNVVLTNVSGTSAAGTVTLNGTMSFTATGS